MVAQRDAVGEGLDAVDAAGVDAGQRADGSASHPWRSRVGRTARSTFAVRRRGRRAVTVRASRSMPIDVVPHPHVDAVAPGVPPASVRRASRLVDLAGDEVRKPARRVRRERRLARTRRSRARRPMRGGGPATPRSSRRRHRRRRRARSDMRRGALAASARSASSTIWRTRSPAGTSSSIAPTPCPAG